MKKYLVQIEDAILPQNYTFDQLIDAGLLDHVDDKIKVKLEGNSVWITARDYPFSNVENIAGNEYVTTRIEQCPSYQQVPPHVCQYNTLNYEASQPRTSQIRRTMPIERVYQRHVNSRSASPSILNKWNWGAFCLSWIWGVCNGIYWPLIMIACNFIPYVGLLCSLGICVYLGVNGNEMAWVNAKQKRTDIYSFESTQSAWNMVGLILFSIGMLFSVFYVLFVTL